MASIYAIGSESAPTEQPNGVQYLAVKAKIQPISFKGLVQKEHKILDPKSDDSTKIAAPSVSHESWVRFTARYDQKLGTAG